MTSLVLLWVLAQDALPPNHPAIGNEPKETGGLPANHPPIDGAGSGALPPNHPKVPPSGESVGPVPPSAEQLLKKLDATADLKTRDKPFEISVSLGRLYMSQARYADAALYFEQARTKAAPVRQKYVEWLKQAGKTPIPSGASAGCGSTGDSSMDSLFVAAQGHATAKRWPEAVACARSALHGTMELDNSLAQTQFLSGDSAAAIKTFTQALELFDGNVDARYGRAAALIDSKPDDLASLKAAQADFEAVVAQAPDSPRARQAQRFLERTRAGLAAGGLSKIAPVKVPEPQAVAAGPAGQMPPPLSKETMEAFQNAPRTPEMNQNFDALVDQGETALASGQFQQALDSFKQVMPYQPENTRLRAGMAWALVKLNKQPMADRVWGVATQTPEAIDALGDALKKKGNAAGAREVWQKLSDSVPFYAPILATKLAAP